MSRFKGPFHPPLLSLCPPPPQVSQKTDCIEYFTALLDVFNIPIRFLIKYAVTLVFIYVSVTAPLL
jgi:hypothetical protein